MELCLRLNNETLWVRIKEQTESGDLVVGIYYELPHLEQQADEAL